MSRPDPPNLPVPASSPGSEAEPRPPRSSRRAGSPGAAFVEAQQEARRGLRDGWGTLDRARRAYLETQWSGEDDRRPEPGLVTRAKL